MAPILTLQPTHAVADLRVDLARLQAENAVLHVQADQLMTLQQRPFAPPRRPDPQSPPAPRGCPVRHLGSSRGRPTRIDQTQVIAAEATCPTCGTACTGAGVTRERVIDATDLTRPTISTNYVIERRWCPQCRTYHENPVTAALSHQRLG